MTYDADCFICGTPVQTFKAWECSMNLRRRTMGGAFMTREGLYVCEKCTEEVLFPKPKSSLTVRLDAETTAGTASNPFLLRKHDEG